MLRFSTVGMEPPQLSVSEERHLAILTELPFVVQFEERVKVRIIATKEGVNILNKHKCLWLLLVVYLD